LLLCGGQGSQLDSWDDEFCVKLAPLGHKVIRCDNRDSGLIDIARPSRRGRAARRVFRAGLTETMRGLLPIKFVHPDKPGLG
jgi:hypothetical protein